MLRSREGGKLINYGLNGPSNAQAEDHRFALLKVGLHNLGTTHGDSSQNLIIVIRTGWDDFTKSEMIALTQEARHLNAFADFMMHSNRDNPSVQCHRDHSLDSGSRDPQFLRYFVLGLTVHVVMPGYPGRHVQLLFLFGRPGAHSRMFHNRRTGSNEALFAADKQRKHLTQLLCTRAKLVMSSPGFESSGPFWGY